MSRLNYLLLAIIATIVFSCSKNEDGYKDGMATIKINFSGTASINMNSKTPNNPSSYTKGLEQLTSTPIQDIEIRLNEKYKIIATLTAEPPKKNKAGTENHIQTKSRVESDLPLGTKYRVIAYDASNNLIEYKDYAVGTPLNSDDSFRVPAGERYTFVAYSVGTTETSDLDDIVPSGNFNDAKFNNVNGNRHFMYYVKPASNYSEGLTTLDIVLKHVFSEIKTIITLDNAVSGTLETIDAMIKPHLNQVDIKVDGASPDYSNGIVSTSGATVSFINSNNGRSAEATTIVTAADQTSTGGGSLIITDISISGESSTQVPPVTGLKIIPGGRYTLTLNVKQFTPDGPTDIDYGDAKWALGNLVYDPSTEIYGFAPTSGDYGNYWFPDYLLPKRLDISNPNPDSPGDVNGTNGDPCSLVLPLGKWRLPTEAEFRSIVRVSGQPFPPLRYIGTYNDEVTNTGMFLDINTHPGSEYEKYLFFVYGGSYNDNPSSVTHLGTTGYYLCTSPTFPGGYKMMQFGNNINTAEIATSINPKSAMQIRCVRSN
ncbi:hypothetical protein [Sphingobacterium faecale]|uniref:Fibrobacter succinogenes major paralogous domain-containing protein n=1 Tax=Sphingobacterium faecale TaxID=2803775 RepID=A0ABS1R8B1_9SPHI|nr:hypothetical protein [Sphingobacterium faecale]MBL1410469.1 hypothetical protein [Sphingobacterium faecale]